MSDRERQIVLDILREANVPPTLFDNDDIEILQNGGLEMSGLEYDNTVIFGVKEELCA